MRTPINPIAAWLRGHAAASLCALLLLSGSPALAESFVVRGATLIDGTGAAPRRADVRVDADRIVEVGTLAARRGETVVEANGLILAPGFIDTHSHHAEGLDKARTADVLLAQGVTSIIVGVDGKSVLPVADLLTAADRAPAAVNIGSYSGHNTVRRAVMGDDYRHEATPAQIAAMGRLVARDMAAGAFGLSTGLEYEPGIFGSHAEVLALARVAARHGGGYSSHIRSEDRAVWEALDEIIRIGRDAHLPVHISHMKLAMTDWWGQAGRYLGQLDAARAEGVRVTGDVYPYTYWRAPLSVLWPDRDFGNRAQAALILGSLAPAEGLRIVSFDARPELVGRTVAEIAKQRGADPVDTLMDIMRESGGVEGAVWVIGTSMAEQDVARFIAWPQANIASDGALADPHPRGAGAFARFWRLYVHDRPLLTEAEAVRKMSALAAQSVGLKQRGVVRPGAFADLVLFDPATFSDRASIENPSLLSVGVARVWVNGTLAWADGRPTGALAGRALRRQR